MASSDSSMDTAALAGPLRLGARRSGIEGFECFGLAKLAEMLLTNAVAKDLWGYCTA